MPFDDYLLIPRAAEQSEKNAPRTPVVLYFSSFPVFHIFSLLLRVVLIYIYITNTLYIKLQPAILKNSSSTFPFFLEVFSPAKQTT